MIKFLKNFFGWLKPKPKSFESNLRLLVLSNFYKLQQLNFENSLKYSDLVYRKVSEQLSIQIQRDLFFEIKELIIKYNTWGNETNGVLKELELIKNMLGYYPIFELFLETRRGFLPHLKSLENIEITVSKNFETLILK